MVQNQAQAAQGGTYGNADADQDKKKRQAGCNHAASPSMLRRPAAASSSASSLVPRMPAISRSVTRSPVTSANDARSNMMASTIQNQIRPATHKNCGIHSGVPIAVLAVALRVHDVMATSLA